VALGPASFLTQFPATSVTVALPHIGHDLAAGVSGLQWVVVAYTLAFAVLLLSGGALADRLGPRRACLIGYGTFAAASLACAAAPTIGLLNLARAAQGVGAALVLPASLALLRQASEGDSGRFTRSLGIWAAIGGASFAAGPLIGGALLTWADWRVSFLPSVPACALGAFFAAGWFRDEPPAEPRKPLDLAGQALAALALCALLTATVLARSGGLLDPWVLACTALAAAAAAAFVLQERRHEAPVLPLGFFREPTFSSPALIGILTNAAFSGILFVLTLYLQRSLGYSTMEAGLAFLPLTATLIVANLLSGRFIARTGPRAPIIVGTALSALGYGLLAPLGADSTLAEMLPGFLLIPLGVGMTVPAIMAANLASVEPRWSGTASAVLNVARQVGGAAGVAAFGALIADETAAGVLPALPAAALVSAALLVASLVSALLMKPRDAPGVGS
jgi:DHA2 family methylenomycin A resistance protein-like MFS transporter